MKKVNKKEIISYLLVTLLLSGCGKKADCNMPNTHAHRYHKIITNDIGIDAYFNMEYINYFGYLRTEDYIDLTKEDFLVFDLLKSKDLFSAKDNWDYLYYLMSTKKDYLMFFYEYDTVEEYTTKDDDGNKETHYKTVHHDGWHSNPNNLDNTGKTRLYHYRYYGYRIVYENNEYKLERSPEVDDIREIINDYPYVNDTCYTTVYETFNFPRNKLPYLNPDDFDIFEGPNLDNKEINYEKKLIK